MATLVEVAAGINDVLEGMESRWDDEPATDQVAILACLVRAVLLLVRVVNQGRIE